MITRRYPSHAGAAVRHGKATRQHQPKPQRATSLGTQCSATPDTLPHAPPSPRDLVARGNLSFQKPWVLSRVWENDPAMTSALPKVCLQLAQQVKQIWSDGPFPITQALQKHLGCFIKIPGMLRTEILFHCLPTKPPFDDLSSSHVCSKHTTAASTSPTETLLCPLPCR